LAHIEKVENVRLLLLPKGLRCFASGGLVCGAGSSPDGFVPLLRRGFRNPGCFRLAAGCGFLEEDEMLVV
jgi:hypothetical protein